MALTYKRFKFVKPFSCPLGEIDAGHELTVLSGQIYYDGGLMVQQYRDFFQDFICAEMEKPNYLREVPIPYNKV